MSAFTKENTMKLITAVLMIMLAVTCLALAGPGNPVEASSTNAVYKWTNTGSRVYLIYTRLTGEWNTTNGATIYHKPKSDDIAYPLITSTTATNSLVYEGGELSVILERLDELWYTTMMPLTLTTNSNNIKIDKVKVGQADER